MHQQLKRESDDEEKCEADDVGRDSPQCYMNVQELILQNAVADDDPVEYCSTAPERENIHVCAGVMVDGENWQDIVHPEDNQRRLGNDQRSQSPAAQWR